MAIVAQQREMIGVGPALRGHILVVERLAKDGEGVGEHETWRRAATGASCE